MKRACRIGLWAMVLAMMAVLGTGRPVFAHHDETKHCHLPNAVQALRVMVRSATAAGDVPDPLVREAIADTLPKFDSAKMPPGGDALPALSQLRSAAVALTGGSREDMRRARSQYEAFETALIPYCERQTIAVAGISPADPEFIATPIEEEGTSRLTSANPVEIARQAGVIFIVMFILIALIVGVERGISAYNAYKFSRKKCRVIAQLVIDGFAVFGHLTILGLRGFRFIPEDPNFIREVPRLARMGEASIKTAGLVIPSELRIADEDGIVGGFEMPLSIAHHRQILAMSTRTPVFFPAARLPPRNIDPFDTGKPKRRAYETQKTSDPPVNKALS